MYDTKKKWYILQTLSGSEHQVVEKIKEKIQSKNMKKFFGKIIIPSERVVEIKNGKKKNNEYKFFPGYILINMFMDEKNWYIIKNIPKIIGFVGGVTKIPTALKDIEIEKIMYQLKQNIPQTKPKDNFEPGEMIRIKSGPFSDFNGLVDSIDYSKDRLKISVLIFGRSTPVELNFQQIEKK